jgi:hypothetical protein
VGSQRAVPAAEEQADYQGAEISTMPMYSPTKKMPPFHARVLDVITVGQLLLGFRLVERVTVGDGHAGNEEGGEAEELRDDEPQVLVLG